MEETKICKECEKEKPIKDFYILYKNKKGETIYRPYCKQCCKEKTSKYKETNKERAKEWNKKSYLKNKEYFNILNKQWKEEKLKEEPDYFRNKQKEHYQRSRLNILLSSIKEGVLLKESVLKGNRIIINYFIKTENRKNKITYPSFKKVSAYVDMFDKKIIEGVEIEYFKMKEKNNE